MTRSDIILHLRHTFPYLNATQAEQAVDIVFDSITATLARGGRVELRGFGAFTVRHRRARLGRNPRLGTPVKVEAKATPFFKAGKELKERMNGGKK